MNKLPRLTRSYAGLSILSVLIGVTISSCSQKEYPVSTSVQKEVETDRTPAAKRAKMITFTEPKCFDDRIKGPTIKKEVLDREAEIEESSITSPYGPDFEWLGAKVGSFSKAGALFMSKHGTEWLYDKVADLYQGCTHVPCLYNRVYELDDENEVGYKLYWFYLQTGYAVAATDAYGGRKAAQGGLVPQNGVRCVPTEEQNKSNEPCSYPQDVKEFLFLPNELDGLVISAALLPDELKNMTHQVSFHRLPDGIDFYFPPRDSPILGSSKYSSISGVTGTSVETLSQNGKIISTKLEPHITLKMTASHLKPFKLEPRTSPQAQIFFTLLHELGHVTDYELGHKQYGIFQYISHREEWKGFTNWELREAINIAHEKKDEKLVAELVAKLSLPEAGEKGVTPYAMTSPDEDFAESVAYYRLQPQELKKAAPNKYEFIKNQVYKGREYFPETVLAHYEKILANEIIQNSTLLLDACQSPDVTLPPEPRKIFSSIKPQIKETTSPTVLNCLYRLSHQRMTEVLNEIRFNEPEGCALLSESNEVKLRQVAMAALSEETAPVIDDRELIARRAQAELQVTALWKESVTPRLFAMNCVVEENPSECFQNQLKDAFARITQENALDLGDQSDRIRDHLTAQEDYQRELVSVEAKVKALFSDMDEKFASSTQKLWKQCEQAHHTPLKPEKLRLIPFSGGDQYILGELINCLNERIEKSVILLFDRELKGLIDSPTAGLRTLSLRYLQSQILRQLDQDSNRFRNDEREELNKIKLDSAPQVQDKLLTQLDWAKGLSDGDEESVYLQKCLSIAPKIYLSVARQEVQNQQRVLRFHILEDQIESWSHALCPELIKEPRFTRFITAETERLIKQSASEWKSALSSLTAVLIDTGKAFHAECIKQTGKKRKSPESEACLLKVWTQVETAALEHWRTKTPLGKKFWERKEMNYREMAAAHLQDERTKAQDRAKR